MVDPGAQLLVAGGGAAVRPGHSQGGDGRLTAQQVAHGAS